MKCLKKFFLVTDLGFIIYWTATLFHIIPDSVAFSDYTNPLIVIWNWSFFPLDMFVSITGLSGIYLYNKKHKYWKKVCLLSLAFTFSSGIQAISFWALKNDFDPMWWIANLYLMIYPLFFVKKILDDRLE